MQLARFTPDDIWHGGFFELSIEVGDRSTPRLNAAIEALWLSPKLKGCYARNDIELETQPVTTPNLVTGEECLHSYGIATLPNGKRIACGSCVVRETDGPDWLDFYFPMGSLGTAYDVGAYPFLEAGVPTPWLPDIERWLAQLGLWLAARIEFRLALIGFEASGATDARTLETEGGVPSARHIGYLYPELGNLKYFPSNTVVT